MIWIIAGLVLAMAVASGLVLLTLHVAMMAQVQSERGRFY